MDINDTQMPWGKHKGKPLKAVPLWYWKWFLQQEWAEHHQDLLVYAEQRTGKKFAPVRKKRECALTPMGEFIGELYDPAANDGSLPFDPD